MSNARVVLAVLTAAVLAGRPTAAQPPEGVKELVVELAVNVKAVLKKREQLGVRVGHFTGTGIDHAEAGGMLTSAIALELGTLVNAEAKLELKGDYQLIEDEKVPGLARIRIEAYLVDLKAGGRVKEFGEFVTHIRNATDIARITGPTLAYKTDAEYGDKPGEGRLKDVIDRLPTKAGKEPPVVTAFVKGGVVRAAEGSKYDVEILCGPTAKGPFAALDATLTDKQFPGLPFVAIAPKHYYQVRVTNRSEVRLGIFLHLDGIDQFTFSEDRAKDGTPKFRFWVVDAGKTITIEGYHKNVDPGEVFGFLTTKAGEGAASKFPTALKGAVGTICVGLAREKQPGEKGSQETVPGDVIPVKQKVVEFKLGDISEFVTVRYSR